MGEAISDCLQRWRSSDKGGELLLQSAIPGARNQPHTTIKGAGHFLQEDKGEELARVIVNFMLSNS